MNAATSDAVSAAGSVATSSATRTATSKPSTHQRRSLLTVLLVLAFPAALAAALTLGFLQWSQDLLHPRVAAPQIAAAASGWAIVPSPGVQEPQVLAPMVETPPAS